MLLESIMYEIETMGKQARMWETRQDARRSCCHLKSERCRHRARLHVKARLCPCHLCWPQRPVTSRRGGGASRCCPRNSSPRFPRGSRFCLLWMTALLDSAAAVATAASLSHICFALHKAVGDGGSRCTRVCILRLWFARLAPCV